MRATISPAALELAKTLGIDIEALAKHEGFVGVQDVKELICEGDATITATAAASTKALPPSRPLCETLGADCVLLDGSCIKIKWPQTRKGKPPRFRERVGTVYCNTSARINRLKTVSAAKHGESW